MLSLMNSDGIWPMPPRSFEPPPVMASMAAPCQKIDGPISTEYSVGGLPFGPLEMPPSETSGPTNADCVMP